MIASTKNLEKQTFTSTGINNIKNIKQQHLNHSKTSFANINMAPKFVDVTQIKLSSTTSCSRIASFNKAKNFEPNTNLIIRNLESHLTESDIIEKMRAYGDIISCKLVRDERTDESKFFSYLQYKDATSATKAIDELNNTYWDEKCDPNYDNHTLPKEYRSRVISVTYANCKRRRMRKKLVKNESKQKQQGIGFFKKIDEQHQDYKVDLLIKNTKATTSSNYIKTSPITPFNFLNKSQFTSRYVEKDYILKESVTNHFKSNSSDITNKPLSDMATFMTTDAFATITTCETAWNKILGTNQWIEYKLF